MNRNKTATQKNFAISPRADVPRSKFRMRQTRKMGFNASELVPIFIEEILPGDTWQHTESIAARLATPIAPIIDDMDLETFYFYVPNRISCDSLPNATNHLTNTWEAFISGQSAANNQYTKFGTNAPYPMWMMGRTTPGGAYEIEVGSVLDHMGITPGLYAGPVIDFGGTDYISIGNGMPLASYFLIYNEWFRDQNLQNPWEGVTVTLTPTVWPNTTINAYQIQTFNNGTDWDGMPLRVNKRHDYFTSSLPWAQKGQAVTIPLGVNATIVPSGTGIPTFDAGTMINFGLTTQTGSINIGKEGGNATGINTVEWNDPALEVDLSQATAATINNIRLAFQTQKMLERDARGGSRYVEQLLAHFGVRSPDYRLQRPEYLGGSKIPITINPIAQTATYSADPGPDSAALGNLGAEMHASGHKRTFTYASTEHGYIIGLACVRSTPTYQQGLRRHWSRASRYDYYWPAFSHLGEQAVHTREIFSTTNGEFTNDTWGYQERYAELRYTPNEITGVLRSTVAQPMDWWHLSEEFANEPALNAAFITDKTQETLERALATQTDDNWACQIIMDILHENTVARLIPTYSTPGLIDHF
jgi:hypothetical protein